VNFELGFGIGLHAVVVIRALRINKPSEPCIFRIFVTLIVGSITVTTILVSLIPVGRLGRT